MRHLLLGTPESMQIRQGQGRRAPALTAAEGRWLPQDDGLSGGWSSEKMPTQTQISYSVYLLLHMEKRRIMWLHPFHWEIVFSFVGNNIFRSSIASMYKIYLLPSFPVV